jgi:phage terminase large subunit-like protein
VREQVAAGKKRIALVAPTAADARDVVVEGESGLLAVCPPWDKPTYEPSKRRVTFANGALCILYSADKPDRLRGPQHDAAWCDELASWRYMEAWDMLMMGLRLGDDPRCVVTTTPRPIKQIKDLLADAHCAVTRGTSYENAANLAPAFLETILKRYEGTRLGRQELNAELLDDNPNALWQRAQIDKLRVNDHPSLVRIVVGVDPQAADPTDTESTETSETGIVVAGVAADGHCYVLGDYSLRASPGEWAAAVVSAYKLHECDRIVPEVNNGGAMVTYTIRTIDSRLPIKEVRASRGKVTRAEPIAALYEQGKVHHVGAFARLEDQMCEWEPGMKSPDRMDALVWALTDLTQKKPRGRGTVGSKQG